MSYVCGEYDLFILFFILQCILRRCYNISANTGYKKAKLWKGILDRFISLTLQIEN